MTSRVDTLHELFEPVIEALGYELWGIEYSPSGKYSLLRVFIDKQEGIDIEDCATASRHISSVLDVEDPISGEYTLEVSSPGLDRPLFKLSQYEKYLGYMLKVRLRQPYEGQRNFKGQLRAIEDDEVKLILGDEEIALPYELIEKANIISQL